MKNRRFYLMINMLDLLTLISYLGTKEVLFNEKKK